MKIEIKYNKSIGLQNMTCKTIFKFVLEQLIAMEEREAVGI